MPPYGFEVPGLKTCQLSARNMWLSPLSEAQRLLTTLKLSRLRGPEPLSLTAPNLTAPVTRR